MEHHQFRVGLSEEPLDHLDAKSTQSVLVDDDNLADISREDAFQKGLKAPALEVEPRANVLDDFFTRTLLLELIDLSLQILLLLGGGDTCVADLDFLLFLVVVFGNTEQAAEVVDTIETLGGTRQANGGDSLFLFPAYEGLARDVILSADGDGGDILGHECKK